MTIKFKNIMRGMLLFTAFLFVFSAKSQFSSIEDFCISENDKALFEKINTYRESQGFKALKLSRALCYVANTHVKDLYFNNPDRRGCSMHSWSDKGRWKPMCFRSFDPNYKGMTAKPKELTYYRTDAYEMIYFSNINASAEEILKQWTELETSKAMLHQEGKWKKYNWSSIGVSTFKGYTAVWLGVGNDTGLAPEVCSLQAQKTPLAKVQSNGPKYHVIIESHSSLQKANLSVSRLRKKGYKSATVVSGNNKFRVSISSHQRQIDADKERKKINGTYKDAWIMKK